MMKNKFLYSMILLAIACAASSFKPDKKKIIVAYVTSWSNDIPNPDYMTHINYAFAHINKTFDGLRIDNEQRLREIVSLKNKNKNLKVMVSVGGWGSGGFSEMVSTDISRKRFAEDCKRVVKEFNLDGIDIDWEYPTSSSANISSSPNDKANYTLLMRDIRKSIGKKKLLTLASVASAEYIDFKSIIDIIDFVNIMSYDMGGKNTHHATLFRSERTGWISCQEAVDSHYKAGVPFNKMTMGLPFYGRGRNEYPNYIDYKDIDVKDGCTIKWDSIASVPYITDREDNFVLGFENKESIALKCKYIDDKSLLGAMYWDYSGDNNKDELRKAVRENIVDK